MENTQLKGLVICILILMASIISTIIALKNDYYAIGFLGIFLTLSSFVIFFLFAGRASCMAKMLNGADVIASWQYSERETIKNIKENKKENRGLVVMAIPLFSIVIIVVALTIGIASRNMAVSIIVIFVVIAFNVLLLKVYLSIKIEDKEITMKGSYMKKSYVYISKSGIYAHGMLNVWKGWGSHLKGVHYDGINRALDFNYTYLRPYGYGRYTVKVKVPEDKLYLMEKIRSNFLASWQE